MRVWVHNALMVAVLRRSGGLGEQVRPRLAELSSGRLRPALDVTDPEPLPSTVHCGVRRVRCSCAASTEARQDKPPER
jgi:hypothetical protein